MSDTTNKAHAEIAPTVSEPWSRGRRKSFHGPHQLRLHLPVPARLIRRRSDPLRWRCTSQIPTCVFVLSISSTAVSKAGNRVGFGRVDLFQTHAHLTNGQASLPATLPMGQISCPCPCPYPSGQSTRRVARRVCIQQLLMSILALQNGIFYVSN